MVTAAMKLKDTCSLDLAHFGGRCSLCICGCGLGPSPVRLAKESTAPAQGNQSLSRELRASQSHNEDPEKDKTPQTCRERDLEEVARQLEMAHEEIRRLADELQGKEKVQRKLGKLC